MINSGSARGTAHELSYSEPGAAEESGMFENVGVLPVDDRLMIMVRVLEGQDDNV